LDFAKIALTPGMNRKSGGRVGQENGRVVANRMLGPTARSRLETGSNLMKKLFAIGLLSIAALSTSTRDAKAWYLGCLCDRCCNNCCEIRLRPYNAFTPVMCCPIFVGGCMPGCMTGGYGGQQGSCFGGASYGPGYCTSGCCDSGCLPAPGTVVSAPQPGMVTAPGAVTTPGIQPQPLPPGTTAPQFQAPNPQFFNPSSYRMPTPPAYGYGQVQPAAYYQPTYNPYYYNPGPVNYYGPLQAPSYWYGR
jgi:hypothetical protein